MILPSRAWLWPPPARASSFSSGPILPPPSRTGGKIDYLEFKASVPPAVRGIVGEIFPPETQIGAVTHFTYFIKPTIRAGDQGFDSVEIATPAGFTSVDSLRLGGVDQAGFTWVAQEDGPRL